jgi:hypothetical protein
MNPVEVWKSSNICEIYVHEEMNRLPVRFRIPVTTGFRTFCSVLSKSQNKKNQAFTNILAELGVDGR